MTPNAKPPCLLLAAALAAAFSCSTSRNGGPPAPQGGTAGTWAMSGAALSWVGDSGSSFQTLGSKQVLAAAMTYPKAMVAEPVPPISLTASDGTGLELVTLDARAVIEGPLAFTELHLGFRNPEDRVIEGRFAITLPPEATVSRLAMRLDTGWQEAEVVERQLARRAYEDFLHRRQDPALLEKEAGNEFRARIFPIAARGEKDIIISYSQPLVGKDAVYTLFLRGLPAIRHLRVNALVADKPGATGSKAPAAVHRSVTMEERGYVPTRDFAVPVPAELTGITSDDLVAVRLRPELTTELQAMNGLVVLFDTSASRAPGFARQVEELGALVRELGALHGGSMKLAVAAFDQAVVPVYEGQISGFGKNELDAVLARRPLGASNLHAALSWAGSRPGLRRILVMTDAIATAGPSEGDELGALVKTMASAVDRLDIILSGGIRDQELAARLARGALPRDGVILDADMPARDLAQRISQTTVSGVGVDIAGAKWVWPRTLDGLQPGDEALVFAQMDKKPEGSALAVSFSGALSQRASVPLAAVARPLLERALVQARIAQLTSDRDELGPDDKARREALKQEIVGLSTRHRVLSDFTALLVLETEEDYARFGIDRRALADILTVGPTGVEVFHRSAPVLMIAEQPPATPDSEATKAAYKNKGKPMGGKDRATGEDRDADGVLDSNDAEGMVDAKPSVEKLDEAKEETSAEAPEPEAEEADEADEGGGESLEVGAGHGAVAAERPAPPARSSSRAPGGRAQPAPADAPRPAMAEPVEGRALSNSAAVVARPPKPEGPPPLTGKLADIMALIQSSKSEKAVLEALAWRNEEPGDVMALVALGEALEAHGNKALAARAYGSIIDLFPARADMRRFAGERLERLGEAAGLLTADTYAKAVAQRPDHLTGHRLLAYALLRLGSYPASLAAIEAGLKQDYPSGRFLGGARILRDDLGLIAAAWLKARPGEQKAIEARLAAAGAQVARTPSLRFVLYWETDANDVDFHIYDGRGGHAFYSQKELPSGGQLYEDVTTGYGPECFTIPGTPMAYPYTLQIHYYSRGPMGYGMGKLEVIEHDGAGTLRFDEHPFVVMNDGAYLELGTVTAGAAQIAR